MNYHVLVIVNGNFGNNHKGKTQAIKINVFPSFTHINLPRREVDCDDNPERAPTQHREAAR